ncbi:copper resistance CopC/CopD family protein [Haloglomus salinum]|uniref:copper resistance CopC/CopD family protein n=1 Tax=Haloglomus salinum TaxID=2962673 RepID=UPI0020C946DB|nr:copper resistance protein CopC [Haloglomus salinum]
MRVATVVLAGLVLALLATPVAAHPFLASSDPAPGESLPEGASVVMLEFGESIDAATLEVTVTGGEGPDLVESVETTGDARTVRVTTASLSPGAYELRWRVTSTDGHPATGTLAFTVGSDGGAGAAGDDAGASDGAAPSWDTVPGGAVALFAETLAGWALLVGALVTVGLAFVGTVVEPTVPRAWRSAVVGTAGLAVAGGLGVVAALAYRHGDLGTAVGTTGGAVRVAGVGLFVAALAASVVARWRPWARRRPGLGGDFHGGAFAGAGALALGGLLADSFASHGLAGASAMGIEGAWVMLVGLVHTSAAAVWLGGLVGVSLTALRASRTDALAAARRFSPWGLGAVVALAVTGVVYADAHLLRWSDLLTTRYGGLILLKAGLIVVPLAFAVYHRYRVLPSGRGDRLRRSVPMEALALAAMLLLAAHLAAHPRPAHDVADADLDRGRWQQVERGEYRFTLVTPDPPRPDADAPVRLRVDSRSLPGISLPTPEVVVDPPGSVAPHSVALVRDGGAWRLPDDVLDRPGEWELEASLDGPHGAASADWTVRLDPAPEVTEP